MTSREGASVARIVLAIDGALLVFRQAAGPPVDADTNIARRLAALREELENFARVQPKTRIFVVAGHDLVRRGLAALLNEEPDMECCGVSQCSVEAAREIGAARPNVVIIAGGALHAQSSEILRSIKEMVTTPRVITLASTEKPPPSETVFALKMDFAAYVLEAVRRAKEPATCEAQNFDSGDQLFTRAGAKRADATQREIVRLIGRGIPDSGIAVQLGLSTAQVRSCRRTIRKTLNSPSAAQFVALCAQTADSGNFL